MKMIEVAKVDQIVRLFFKYDREVDLIAKWIGELVDRQAVDAVPVEQAKAQMIEEVKSLEVLIGCTGVSVLTKGIEGLEGITDEDFLDEWFANRTLEVKEYYDQIREASNPYQVAGNSIKVWDRTPKE